MIAPTTTQNLSPSDVSRLKECEKIVERGIATFVEVGAALSEIRDDKLYRDSHATFADYCRDRYGMSDRHARRLMDASDVVGQIGPVGPLSGKAAITENAVRPIAALPNDVQREAVESVKEKIAAGAEPREAIKEAVAEVRPPAPPKPAAPAPSVETEPDNHHDDITAELERADKQIRELEDTIASLSKDDTAREVRALHAKIAQLNANHQGTLRTLDEARKTVTYQASILTKLRKALGVEKDRDIVSAVEALRK